jgi:glycosyltransferase involved in cell wall biosynthesis
LRFCTPKALVVVTSVTRWDEPPRIRHQVARQLLRFYNVLYVELPLHTAPGQPALEQIADDLIIFRPPGYGRLRVRLRSHVPWVKRRLNAQLTRCIEEQVRSMGGTVAALVNFQFDFPQIMSSAVFPARIYLCNDDFHGDARWWARAANRRAEDDVIRAASASLAVSLPLLDRLRRLSDSASLFMPGHEFGAADEASMYASFQNRSRPIRVAYMGYLNERMRTDWLGEMLQDPRFRLSLTGPVEHPSHWRSLLSHAHVDHVDTLVGERLQARLQEADVFVMPYDVRQPAVRAITAPNKLFQYLACGRPVVCSNLPGLIQTPEKFVYVAPDAQQFVQAVGRAFEEDDETLTRARLRFADENRWSVRGDGLRRLIEYGALA